MCCKCENHGFLKVLQWAVCWWSQFADEAKYILWLCPQWCRCCLKHAQSNWVWPHGPTELDDQDGNAASDGISNSESESRTACSAGQTSQLRQLRPLRPERRRAADWVLPPGSLGNLKPGPARACPLWRWSGELAARPGTSWRLPRAWPMARWARPGRARVTGAADQWHPSRAESRRTVS